MKNIPVVSFGEVLWDIFPDKKVAGGAPFNVAYHLNKMGLESHILSKVGDDTHGRELLAKITAWGMNTEGIQITNQRPTGTVKASTDSNHEAHYEIVNHVAWDEIALRQQDRELCHHAKALIFGTLSSRNPVSRNTLMALLETPALKVLDINLRPPFTDYRIIRTLIQKADILKMNRQELLEITALEKGSPLTEKEALHFMEDRFKPQGILISKGREGALYVEDGICYESAAVPVSIKDTVGSGDAFLAGFLAGRFLKANPEDEPLHLATFLGAFITSREGACPEYAQDTFHAFKRETAALQTFKQAFTEV